MPDGDDEVPAGEAHHLAGLDDLAARGELGVLDVVDGLEDGEESVVVPLQLRPLVGVDGVLDGERVEAELAGDTGEFLLGRLVQADPGEAALLAHLEHRLVRRAAGAGLHAPSVAVDRAVDDRAGGGRVTGGVVTVVQGVALTQGRAHGGAQVADHRHGWLLHGGPSSGTWNSPEWGRVLTSAKRAAPQRRDDGVRYRQAKKGCSSVVRNARGLDREGFRSPKRGEERKSGWYCTVDFDPLQPHLLQPVPRGG